MSIATSPAGTDALSVDTIVRAYDAVTPNQLYYRFQAQLPPDARLRTLHESYRGNADDTETLQLAVWAWFGDGFRGVSKHDTVAYVPGFEVSLSDGRPLGYFNAWGKLHRPSEHFRVYLTIALHFELPPDRFPEVIGIADRTLRAIESGELAFPKSSERRASYLAMKAALFPWWERAGLVTTVLRRAPSTAKLWEALPPDEFHEAFPRPKQLGEFLENDWDSGAVYRATKDTDAGRHVRWLLEKN
jgi:hypothetical protein